MSVPDWHIVTSEYPPAIGGVSDYTFAIAGALGARAVVQVWCPSSNSTHPEQSGVRTHEVRDFGLTELIRLGRRLDEGSRVRRLFVQWTPQGFGWRSLNILFAGWLAWRGWFRGDAIDLMVHEPYLSWSVKPTRLVAAVIHRLMLWLACSSATRVWVSTTAWLAYVRPYLWSRAPLRWLPVPAPDLALDSSPRASKDAHTDIVVGHFSMHSPLITPLLTVALDTILAGSHASILLIGQGSDAFRSDFLATRSTLADRVHATGEAPAPAITRALLSCDLMVQPYPDGVTTRRTSLLTTMALGLPAVTNDGRLTEDLWRKMSGVTVVAGSNASALGEQAVRLIEDADTRRRLGEASRTSYEERFALHNAMRLLNEPMRN